MTTFSRRIRVSTRSEADAKQLRYSGLVQGESRDVGTYTRSEGEGGWDSLGAKLPTLTPKKLERAGAGISDSRSRRPHGGAWLKIRQPLRSPGASLSSRSSSDRLSRGRPPVVQQTRSNWGLLDEFTRYGSATPSRAQRLYAGEQAPYRALAGARAATGVQLKWTTATRPGSVEQPEKHIVGPVPFAARHDPEDRIVHSIALGPSNI